MHVTSMKQVLSPVTAAINNRPLSQQPVFTLSLNINKRREEHLRYKNKEKTLVTS